MKILQNFNLRIFWIVVYFVCFAAFLITGFTPAEASKYKISANLEIPSIGLMSDVTNLKIVGRTLETPDDIIGSYNPSENKILLVGHSSSVFGNLDRLWIEDKIIYNNETFSVTNYRIYKKDDLDMNTLLSREPKKTLVLMTCIGTSLPNNDATHRLVITAEVQ